LLRPFILDLLTVSNLNYSIVEDFVTVTLSVRLAVVALVPLLPPLIRATSNKMKTTAPITQTQGEVYQPASEETLKDFVVVVVEPEPEVLEPDPCSCAHVEVCINAIINKANIDLSVSPFASCFIANFFVYNFRKM
jgi:hypothetical protein